MQNDKTECDGAPWSVQMSNPDDVSLSIPAVSKEPQRGCLGHRSGIFETFFRNVHVACSTQSSGSSEHNASRAMSLAGLNYVPSRSDRYVPESSETSDDALSRSHYDENATKLKRKRLKTRKVALSATACAPSCSDHETVSKGSEAEGEGFDPKPKALDTCPSDGELRLDSVAHVSPDSGIQSISGSPMGNDSPGPPVLHPEVDIPEAGHSSDAMEEQLRTRGLGCPEIVPIPPVQIPSDPPCLKETSTEPAEVARSKSPMSGGTIDTDSTKTDAQKLYRDPATHVGKKRGRGRPPKRAKFLAAFKKSTLISDKSPAVSMPNPSGPASGSDRLGDSQVTCRSSVIELPCDPADVDTEMTYGLQHSAGQHSRSAAPKNAICAERKRSSDITPVVDTGQAVRPNPDTGQTYGLKKDTGQASQKSPCVPSSFANVSLQGVKKRGPGRPRKIPRGPAIGKRRVGRPANTVKKATAPMPAVKSLVGKPAEKVKRPGPGRPKGSKNKPKPQPLLIARDVKAGKPCISLSSTLNHSLQGQPVKRKPGRPRKHPLPDKVSVALAQGSKKRLSELKSKSSVRPGDECEFTTLIQSVQDSIVSQFNARDTEDLNDFGSSDNLDKIEPSLSSVGQVRRDPGVQQSGSGKMRNQKAVPKIRKPRLHVMMRSSKRGRRKKKKVEPSPSSFSVECAAPALEKPSIFTSYSPSSFGFSMFRGTGFKSMSPMFPGFGSKSLFTSSRMSLCKRPFTHMVSTSYERKLKYRSHSSKRKKKLRNVKSKHKNIVDPAFLSDLDDLTEDLDNLWISKGSDPSPTQSPGQKPLPSIFRLPGIAAKKRKKDKEKFLIGEKPKKSKKSDCLDKLVKDKAKGSRKKGLPEDGLLLFQDNALVSSQQCLPLKKRHKLFTPTSPASPPSSTFSPPSFCMPSIASTTTKQVGTVSSLFQVSPPEKRKVGRPRKHPLPETSLGLQVLPSTTSRTLKGNHINLFTIVFRPVPKSI